MIKTLIVSVMVILMSGSVVAYNAGLGYMSNLPKECYGLSFIQLREGVGIAIDFRADWNTPTKANSYGTITKYKAESVFSDIQTSEKISNTGIGTALTFPLADSVYGFVGLVFYTQKTYLKYYDSYQILSSSGDYWIQGKDKKTIRVQGGLVFRNDKTYILVGISGEPIGVMVGFGVLFF